MELLYLDTIQHGSDRSEEVCLDIVRFAGSRTATVREIRVLLPHRQVRINDTSVVSGFTTPGVFQLQVFISNLRRSNNAAMHPVGVISVDQNGENRLVPELLTPTDGIAFMGSYTRLTVAILGERSGSVVGDSSLQSLVPSIPRPLPPPQPVVSSLPPTFNPSVPPSFNPAVPPPSFPAAPPHLPTAPPHAPPHFDLSRPPPSVMMSGGPMPPSPHRLQMPVPPPGLPPPIGIPVHKAGPVPSPQQHSPRGGISPRGRSPRKRRDRRDQLAPPPKRRPPTHFDAPSPPLPLEQPISSDEEDEGGLPPSDDAALEAISDDEIQAADEGSESPRVTGRDRRSSSGSTFRHEERKVGLDAELALSALSLSPEEEAELARAGQRFQAAAFRVQEPRSRLSPWLTPIQQKAEGYQEIPPSVQVLMEVVSRTGRTLEENPGEWLNELESEGILDNLTESLAFLASSSAPRLLEADRLADVTEALVSWAMFGLDNSEANAQPAPAAIIRHLKTGIRLASLIPTASPAMAQALVV